jgi:hypothetical protein
MDLESDTSRVFSVMKKKADSILGDEDEEDCMVELSDKDIFSIKKFFAVSWFRTEFYRNHVFDPDGVFPPKSSPIPIGDNDNWISLLRLILKNSPETLLEWKGDGGSDSIDEATARAIRVYQIINNMQLHIWRTSGAGEEFMLGADHVVHIEGLVRDANSQNNPKVAHMLLPISPSVVVAACDSQCCRQGTSTLSKYQHAAPREHVLRGRKKPGQKGYRPARNVWKYLITECEKQQMLTINTQVFESSRVVFRSHTAFERFCDSLITTKNFKNGSESHERSTPVKACEQNHSSENPRPHQADTKSDATKAVMEWLEAVVRICKQSIEDSQIRKDAIAILNCIVYGMMFYTSTEHNFEGRDYLASRGVEYGINAVLESLDLD